MTNVWSYDDGYGDNKGSSQEKLICIPNAIAPLRFNSTYDEILEGGELLDKHDFSDELHKYIKSTVDGKDYTLGEYAIIQNKNLHWGGMENKHNDLFFPAMFKTFLGLMAEKQLETVDTLVMGLPCGSVTDERVEKLTELALNGEHKSEITLADFKTVQKSVTVNNIIVKEQAFGSFSYILLDEYGQVENKDVAKQLILIVDIGSKTLNLYLVDSMNPVREVIDHTDDGMYSAYYKIGQSVQYTGGTATLPIIVKTARYGERDITDIVDSEFMSLASNISNFILSKTRGFYNNINQIVFTGGGATILKDYLEQTFADKNTRFLNRFANAEGLRRYGLFKTGKVVSKIKKR
jgi:plasmid segregation protein ParM